MKKLDRYEFIWKAIQKHGYKDDLRECDYKNASTKVKIICPIHGEFYMLPYNYLRGHRCKKCGDNSLTKELFIELGNKIHNYKFDYSNVKFVNSATKVKIKCKICGYEFEQTPHCHINRKQGCPKCSGKHITNDEIIEKIHKKYGDLYDTSLVKYESTDKKIKLICKKHSMFEITPHSLFRGRGCPICGKESSESKRRMTKEIFIEKSNKTHIPKRNGNNYIYDEVEYKNARTKVKIICPIHGEFWQMPYLHIQGHGCPLCSTYSGMEDRISFLLKENNLEFIYNYNSIFLGLKSLDFYIPSLKVAIECQGLQHFKPIKWYGGEEKLNTQIIRDKQKKKLCDEHNIKLFYFTDQKQIKEYELGKLYYDENELLKEILQYNDNNR